MTLYPGERTIIIHTATDEDGVGLTADLVDSVLVTVFSRDFATTLVAETPMTWRVAKSRWEYSWATASVPAGTYQAKVRILGLDGRSVWEYQRLRLVKDPAVVS